MKAYENNSAAYFATPPVNLLYAYHASLTQITQGSVSLEDRFEAHKAASRRVKEFAENLGFKNVPLSEEVSAHGMTAVSQSPRPAVHIFISRTALLPRGHRRN